MENHRFISKSDLAKARSNRKRIRQQKVHLDVQHSVHASLNPASSHTEDDYNQPKTPPHSVHATADRAPHDAEDHCNLRLFLQFDIQTVNPRIMILQWTQEVYRKVGNKHLPSRSILVDASGHENFSTIQTPIDSVPSNNRYWVSIKVKADGMREAKEKVKIIRSDTALKCNLIKLFGKTIKFEKDNPKIEHRRERTPTLFHCANYPNLVLKGMPSSSRSQKKNIRNSSVARITFMGDLSCRKIVPYSKTVFNKTVLECVYLEMAFLHVVHQMIPRMSRAQLFLDLRVLH
ncbi:hypothetical protein JHK82_018968 [Glycine max]|nr:hypothetical protein JHK82_018968 [Glycine max]